MKLYYMTGACSLAPHILGYELGLPLAIERVDMKEHRTETGADFKAINPRGYVPVLELDDGQRLTEAAVILQYLADQKPELGLMPRAGTLERYRAQEWLNYIATELHKGFWPLTHAERYPEEVKAMARDALSAQLHWVAPQLEKRPFLMGDQLTAPDIYLFVVLNWSRFAKFDLTPWPAIQAYQEKMKARETTRSALRAEGILKDKK